MRPVSGALFVAIFLATLPSMDRPARAGERYKCDYVTDIARLGTYATDEVTIESGDDEIDGTYCSFSINGIAASSPTQKSVQSALQVLRDVRDVGDASKLTEDSSPLAWLLIAAGTEKQPSELLLSLLKKASPDLAKCLNDFYNFSLGDKYGFGEISCTPYPPGKYPLFTITSPKAEIIVKIENKVRRLYLSPRSQ